MWSVVNRTSYSAKGAWGRNQNGSHEWLVAVKGVFDISNNGRVSLSDNQEEPRLLPEYRADSGTSSLRYESDLLGSKPSTDIILNGTAYAPKGRPSTAFVVSLRIGQVYKELKVVGDRFWEGGLFRRISPPHPVAEVPVIYERAYGGFDNTDPDPRRQRMDPRNPVGCGLVTEKGSPLPNFEYPGQDLETAGPAGFASIASHWSPRRELNGTFDAQWRLRRSPLLPADWDPLSLLCAPKDQRPNGFLIGGEVVELINLTANGRLSFLLPKVQLIFSTRIHRRIVEHQSQLTSVIIEPDEGRVIMVWLSCLPCHADVDYLERTTIHEALYTS